MPCHYPLPAWQTPSKEVILWKEQPDSHHLRLPCGNCIGCRTAAARAWALRCHLELQQHASAVFATLTYDDAHLPNTLQKRDLQLWLKNLRHHISPQRIRFFASGEYGEKTYRPHYHAILFGLRLDQANAIQHTWPHGHTRADPVGPGAISYVAGYTSKKIGFKQHARENQVDPETGEVYTWQPPFIQMSRGGRNGRGIGGAARDQYTQSWRLYAIHQGFRLPVPRYLHEAWKNNATKSEIEQLEQEKHEINKKANRNTTTEANLAREKHDISKQRLAAAKRSL